MLNETQFVGFKGAVSCSFDVLNHGYHCLEIRPKQQAKLK